MKQKKETTLTPLSKKEMKEVSGGGGGRLIYYYCAESRTILVKIIV